MGKVPRGLGSEPVKSCTVKPDLIIGLKEDSVRRKKKYPGLREKNGKWEYRFMLDGRPYQRLTDLEATARNASVALKLREDHRQMVLLGEAVKKRVQFNEAAERFIAWSKQAHRDHPNTWKRQRTSLASLQEMLGHLYVDTLKPGNLDDYMTWRRENKISEVTLRHDLHALSQLCQYAMRQEWMDTNPVRAVDMPSDRDSRNERVLTDEEERLYFETAQRHPVAFDIGRLIILQGMRPEEVLSLSKDHVDLEHRTLRVAKGKSRSARRTLDLTAESLTTLGRRMQWDSPFVFPGMTARHRAGKGNYQPVKGRRGFVFGSHERPYTYSAYIKAHNAICEECGVLFDPYSLRHTFATRFYTETKDIFALQKVLGHADLKTLQRYVHVDEEHVREAMRKFEEGLRPVVEVIN